LMAAGKHGLIVYLGTVVNSLIMLAAKVLIQNRLGTDVLGKYELGLSLVLLISVFAMFGFHTSLARAVAKEGKDSYPLVKRVFYWVVGVSVAAVAISTPVINTIYGSKVVPNFAVYLSLLLLAVCLLNLNMAFFQGLQKMAHVSVIMALDAVFRGSAVLLAVIFALRAESILLTIGAFALAFELVVTAKIFSRIAGYANGSRSFREFAHLSFYIFLIAASGTISTRISAFVIAYHLTFNELGLFAIATLFTLPLLLLGRTIETVLLPRASIQGDFELRRFAALAAGLALAAVPVFYVLADVVVPLLFGPESSEAVGLLRILAIGYSAILVYSVFSAFIFGRASRDYLRRIVIFTFAQALLIAPALNAYLVAEMGVVGAAWATNVALIIQTCVWVVAGLILERRETKSLL